MYFLDCSCSSIAKTIQYHYKKSSCSNSHSHVQPVWLSRAHSLSSPRGYYQAALSKYLICAADLSSNRSTSWCLSFSFLPTVVVALFFKSSTTTVHQPPLLNNQKKAKAQYRWPDIIHHRNTLRCPA